jgi:hypothetical protein
VRVGGVEEGKVPFGNRRVSIFNMAATATILKLASVDFAENGLYDAIFVLNLGFIFPVKMPSTKQLVIMDL